MKGGRKKTKTPSPAPVKTKPAHGGGIVSRISGLQDGPIVPPPGSRLKQPKKGKPS